MVVPANSFSIELAQNSEFRLWIFGDDGNVYYDVVKIQAQDALKDVVKYAPRESTGLNNVHRWNARSAERAYQYLHGLQLDDLVPARHGCPGRQHHKESLFRPRCSGHLCNR